MTNYKILSTKDYSAFKGIKGNRTVRPAHVKKLITAIQADPEAIKYNPILINEKWEVIDGQHRLEAIKALELEVFYVQVEGLTLTNVQKINSIAKQWQPIDYAKAFAKLGNKNYAHYVEVKEDRELTLNHDSLMRYLALDNPITSQSFNEGKLKVDNFRRSVELLKQLREVGEYYARYNIRSFALAFLTLARQDDYNHKQMLHQMKKYANDMIEDYSKEQDYYMALIKLYNYQKAKRNKHFFGVPEYLLAK